MRPIGFQKSEIDGTEHVFDGSLVSEKMPEEYSYEEYLPRVVDQGPRPICVPCSISAYLNWRENLPTGSKSNNGIDYEELYSSKKSVGEGMTFKEAFNFLRHQGVKSKIGRLKIGEYAMIKSEKDLKAALFTNGPCVGALPVYNSRGDFWIKRAGDCLVGYHAISIVGYDKVGFIIRNSYGTSFGRRGYVTLPYSQMKSLIEIWTVIE